MKKKSPPAKMPEGFGDGTSIKIAGCCQMMAAGGSLYKVYNIPFIFISVRAGALGSLYTR